MDIRHSNEASGAAGRVEVLFLQKCRIWTVLLYVANVLEPWAFF